MNSFTMKTFSSHPSTKCTPLHPDQPLHVERLPVSSRLPIGRTRCHFCQVKKSAIRSQAHWIILVQSRPKEATGASWYSRLESVRRFDTAFDLPPRSRHRVPKSPFAPVEYCTLSRPASTGHPLVPCAKSIDSVDYQCRHWMVMAATFSVG